MKRPWVIKAGGELLVNKKTRQKILKGVVSWHRSHPIVFVHGGGPQIEAELTKNKIASRFFKGRRVTSLPAMEVVERVLCGPINKDLAAQITRWGVPSLGLSGRDAGLMRGQLIPGLGRAAKPNVIKTSMLLGVLKAGFLPVISSIASDKNGWAVNINADEAASALAIAMGAEHLIFLTNIPGVLDQNQTILPVLRVKAISRLIHQNIITRGMIPKVEAAAQAIQKGVKEVNILNGRKGINFKFGTKIIR